MLVLSRHRDGVIVIGPPGPNQVRIRVVDIRGDKVRLGVEADSKIPVHREEVYNAILAKNPAALGVETTNA